MCQVLYFKSGYTESSCSPHAVPPHSRDNCSIAEAPAVMILPSIPSFSLRELHKQN